MITLFCPLLIFALPPFKSPALPSKTLSLLWPTFSPRSIATHAIFFANRHTTRSAPLDLTFVLSSLERVRICSPRDESARRIEFPRGEELLLVWNSRSCGKYGYFRLCFWLEICCRRVVAF
ncbi:hypothetical protein BDV93DRAFT_525422 [Ceratobasidium sp. AG-I]|nr:hypothetical protein BDV93DRAFT_525422 [Ceratobasidium sp. AG-I]